MYFTIESLTDIFIIGCSFLEIVRFLFIGTLNTIFYYAIYALFIFIGFNYILALSVSTLIGMLFSFKMFGKFVFNSSDGRLIAKFVVAVFINYLIAVCLVYMFKQFGFNYYLSGLFASIIGAGSSFLLNKYYVFKKNRG
ncbi:MAG: GtrA family protein [Arcobacteraceae bacterium]